MQKNGYVYHVVMYAGDGKTIEAANMKMLELLKANVNN